MSRSIFALTVGLAVVTVPLMGIVREDLRRWRVQRFRMQSYASPREFRGLRLDGKLYELTGSSGSTRTALFVLHRENLAQEVVAWDGIQAALTSSGIELVGTCENAACAAELRRGDVVAHFTVLAAAALAQASSLARLDAAHQWMVCDRSGRVLGVFPIPSDPGEATAMVRVMLGEGERNGNDKTPVSS
jgi:hypothetical protein